MGSTNRDRPRVTRKGVLKSRGTPRSHEGTEPGSSGGILGLGATTSTKNQNNQPTTQTTQALPTTQQNNLKDNPMEIEEQHLITIQINLQKSKAATATLSQKLTEEQIDVALITEPHLYNGKNSHLKTKHHKTIKPRTREMPRVCILTHKRLKVVEIPELTSKDTIAVLIETSNITNQKHTIFASVYQPPEYENPPPTQELENIIKYAKTKQLPLIIGCDTNGHHEMWGSKNANKRGNHLAEYIIKENLFTANQGNEPTFQTHSKESVIDVTICTQETIPKITEWKVLQEESMSDHKYITFKLQSKTTTTEPKRNPRRTNWNKYQKHIKKHLVVPYPFLPTKKEIEKQAQELTDLLTKAFKTATKKPKQTTKKANAPWWTLELTNLRKNTTHARNRYLCTKRQDHKEIWQDLRRTYSNTIQREKRRGWKTFTTKIESLPEAQRLTRILQQGDLPSPNLVKKPDGTYTQSPSEALQHLLDVHFPENTPQNTPRTKPRINQKDIHNKWIEASKIVSETKIKRAIESFQPYKSPGTDGIYPIMLQKAIDAIVTNLDNIYRACLVHGYIPEVWRESKVVFIPKPGKETYDTPKSFRPISLTSFLLKTLERLVDRHLREETLKKQPFNKNQHAYQEGRTTETALHDVTTAIDKAIERKGYAIGAFFDIQGAFDNAPTNIIIKALKKRNTTNIITDWITQLLTSRKVTASMGTTELQVNATRGCPQGGVLSPTLWCLVVDELLDKLNKISPKLDAFGYSDDGTIIARSKNKNEVGILIQEGLTIVDQWCKENGLSISAQKQM